MFNVCILLKNLPDISNWDTSNVVDMSKMFMLLKNIVAIPHISKWSTKNVINLTGMFLNCSSLTSLPKLDNWNFDNLKDNL